MARLAASQVSLRLLQESSLGHQPCHCQERETEAGTLGLQDTTIPCSRKMVWLFRREQPPVGVVGNNGQQMRLGQGWRGRKGAARDLEPRVQGGSGPAVS